MKNLLPHPTQSRRRQTIHCPNCGSHALRQQYLIEKETITETACPVCDYLLVSSELTGRVMDSYLSLVK
jgi:transcription elongation factor Elf1